MQEALSICQETAHLQWDFQRTSRVRIGERPRMPGIGTYQTQDGYIYSAVGIPGFGSPWSELISWMEEEGRAEDLTDPLYAETFANFNMRALGAQEELERLAPIMNRAHEVLTAFYESKTSMEAYEQGQERRLLIGMVASPADIGESAASGGAGVVAGVRPADHARPGRRAAALSWSAVSLVGDAGDHSSARAADSVNIIRRCGWMRSASPPKDLIAFAGEGAV